MINNRKCTLCKKLLNPNMFYNTNRNQCKKCLILRNGKARKVKFSPAWMNRRYNKVKENARIKGRSFNLTKEEFYKIHISKICHYCGTEPEVYSIDRVNNNIGYELYNCVLACKTCNSIKNVYTKDELVKYRDRLVEKARKVSLILENFHKNTP